MNPDFIRKVTETFMSITKFVDEHQGEIRETVDGAKKFISMMTEKKLPENVLPIQIEFLTKEKLLSYIEENKVPAATEVAAMISKDKKANYIYTAFISNGELMSQEHNKYLIFISDGLSRDVETLFDENELIILH